MGGTSKLEAGDSAPDRNHEQTKSDGRKRCDRLVRSTFELFAIVKRIVDAEAQFGSLTEPWADTHASTGRLMIAVLGGLADVERDLIRTRTAEGQHFINHCVENLVQG